MVTSIETQTDNVALCRRLASRLDSSSGMLEEMKEDLRAPELWQAFEGLRSDRRDLARQLRTIADELEDDGVVSEGDDPLFDLRYFIETVDRHEINERELIYCAFWDDLGTAG